MRAKLSTFSGPIWPAYMQMGPEGVDEIVWTRVHEQQRSRMKFNR
jgi:hypothetical protein